MNSCQWMEWFQFEIRMDAGAPCTTAPRTHAVRLVQYRDCAFKRVPKRHHTLDTRNLASASSAKIMCDGENIVSMHFNCHCSPPSLQVHTSLARADHTRSHSKHQLISRHTNHWHSTCSLHTAPHKQQKTRGGYTKKRARNY